MPEPQPDAGPAGHADPTPPTVVQPVGGDAGDPEPPTAPREAPDGDTATDHDSAPGEADPVTRVDGPAEASPPDDPGATDATPTDATPTDATPTDVTPAGGGTARTGDDGPTRVDPAPEADDRPGPQRTAVAPPRWTGSAAVPPPPPKPRRWWRHVGADHNQPPPAPPREPTLHLPPEERAALEAGTPVDPWADADPLAGLPGPWHDPSPWPAEPHTPPELPPTRPYPVPPPQPPAPQPPAPQPPAPQPPAPRGGGPALPGAHPAPSSPVPYPAAQPRPSTRPYPVPQPALPVPYRPAGPPAVPAQRGPAGPPRQTRKQRRRASAPQAPPPGWQAPPGYVPVAVRRKRRWPLRLLVFTVLTFACCCGLPWYYGQPLADQYPAHASLPTEVDDLRLREDEASLRAAQRLEQDMRAQYLFAEGTFAGVYADGSDKRVVVFGVTGLRLRPETDLDTELARLTGVYQLTDVHPVDTAARGTHQRCGTGRLDDGTPVVLCSWADHGSLATALFTRRSIDDSARLLDELRTVLLVRG